MSTTVGLIGTGWKDIIGQILFALFFAFLFMTVILIATNDIYGVKLLWLKWF